MDAPLIVQLAVEELKDASILRSHAETPSARDAPGLFDSLDRQALAFPPERRRSLGISIVRMTLDLVRRHARGYSQSRRQKMNTTITATTTEPPRMNQKAAG